MQEKRGRFNTALWMGATLLLFLLSGCITSKQVRLGDEYAKDLRWDEAYQMYSESLKKDPLNQPLKRKTDDAKVKAAAVHADRGKALLDQKNISVALEEYKRAMLLDPGRTEYQDAFAKALRKKEALEDFALGQKLLKAERFSEAIEYLERALERDPTLPQGKEVLAQATKRQRTAGEEVDELSLKSSQPITLKFQNARLKEVFELLAKSAGINILFDKDVRDETMSIFVKDASFKEALNLILSTNNLFMKKISDETILVIPKTKQKVDQYQDLMIRTFYLSNVKAKDMVNLLRTMLETRRVFVNDELNTIVLRDTPEKIKLAEKIIDANDRKVAEVMFEVEILEIDKTKGSKLGWNFSQNQVSAFIGNSTTGSTTGNTGTSGGGISLDSLRNLNDSTIFFVLPSLLVDFFKQESDAQTLANPRVRVIDNKSAKINIGDRVPILLSTTTTAPTTTATIGPTTTTSIEFKDVGIKLTIEPNIHLTNDVTMKLNLEVTSLGDLVNLGNGQQQFRFGNRNTETVLSVKDSETVVISGLIRDDERTTINKIPGLGDIPFIGRLFSHEEKNKAKTDIVMTITPHILRNLETPEKPLQSFWSGTEETYSTRPLFSDFQTVGDVRRESQAAPAPAPTAPVPPPLENRSTTPLTPVPENRLTPILSVIPRESNVAANGTVNVEVRVDNVKSLSGATMSIAFDPTVVSLKGVVEGDFLKRDGKNISLVSSTQPGGATVDVQITREADEVGISGSGTLFTLTFSGDRAGASSRIDFRNVRLLDPSHGPINVDIFPGLINVR